MSGSAAPGGRIPLCVPTLYGTERDYVLDALDSTFLAYGPYIARFEEALKAVTGSAHVVACVNGTAALHMALRIAGVESGDLVVVPTATFVATVNAVAYLGADPVFMDCDEYLGMDTAKLAEYLDTECAASGDGLVETASGRRVRAVLPVHVFGNPCDTAAIGETCRRHGLPMIEDAAESLGSRYTDVPLAGTHTGTTGRMGALSFNANKIVTAGGGGALLARDAADAERAAYLLAQAKDDPLFSVHDEVGYNYRLSNLHAAVALAQVEHLDDALASRAHVRELYAEGLGGVPGLSFVADRPGTGPNGWLPALVVDETVFGADRDGVMRALDASGIESRPLWRLNHRQRPFAACRAYRIERAPVFERRVLNLPCSSGIPGAGVARVVAAVREAGGA